MIGKIIELDPDDDVASAGDRIEWAKADRVALVLAPGAAWRELDFERLKRSGKQLGSEVAVVSNDLNARLAAREVGLVAFATSSQATRQRWLPNPGVEDLRRLTPPRRFAPSSLRQFFPKRPWLRWLFGAVTLLASLAVVSGAALIFVPTAKVSMTASSQPLQMIVPVNIDFTAVDVNLAERIVPGQRVDVVIEDRIAVETTGKRSIPRYRAQGSVTFFNNLSTPYTVPANSVVRTSGSSSPARFVTLGSVEVPPGGRASAGVEAVDEGGIGNVPAGAINQVEGVPSLAVRVTNGGGTGGGGNETVRAVTQSDIDRAKRQLREKLFAEAVERMKTLPEVASSGLYVVPETLFIAEVQDETADRFVTEQADAVNVSTRIQVAALAVSPADLNTIARAALQEKAPKGFSLLSARALRGDAAEEDSGVGVKYFLVARGIAGAEINEGTVRRIIAGKTRSEAQTALLQEFDLSSTPRISLQPDWWVRWIDRVPWITLRIDTEVKRE